MSTGHNAPGTAAGRGRATLTIRASALGGSAPLVGASILALEPVIACPRDYTQ